MSAYYVHDAIYNYTKENEILRYTLQNGQDLLYWKSQNVDEEIKEDLNILEIYHIHEDST